jgi:hypothetical protein
MERPAPSVCWLRPPSVGDPRHMRTGAGRSMLTDNLRITSCGQAGRSQGREGDCGARRLTITRTMTVGMDAPALDGWTPLGHPAGPPPVRTESFVIRTPRPTRTDGRLQTTTGTRPAMRSGRGGRPPGCPLAPSSRPSKVSILDGCPGGCPNGCPANGSGASIPTACRAWKVQENSMSGSWRSARRRLAPTTRPWPAIRGNLDVVLQALKDAPPEVYHGRLGTFLDSGQPRRPVPRRAAGVLPGRV